MATKPSPPPPPRMSGDQATDSKAMENWYAAFYDNALRGTRLLDPAKQFVPDEFDPDNLTDPTDSSIANAQLTANEAYNKGLQVEERTIPVGAIVHFPKEPPNFSNGGDPGEDTKWLECDGSTYNASDFQDLADFLGVIEVEGEEDTFVVPNYTDSGRFLRSRTGVLSEGTMQSSAVASHTHSAGSLSAVFGGEHDHTAATSADGIHSHGGITGTDGGGTTSTDGGGTTSTDGGGTTSSDGSHSHGAATGADGAHSHIITINDPTHVHGGSSVAGAPTLQSGGSFGTVNSGQTNAAATGITASSDIVPSHTHIISADGTHSHSISAHQHSIPAHQHSVPAHQHSISSDGSHQHTVSIINDGLHSHSITGTSGTNGSETETRPEAAVVVICIRT